MILLDCASANANPTGTCSKTRILLQLVFHAQSTKTNPLYHSILTIRQESPNSTTIYKPQLMPTKAMPLKQTNAPQLLLFYNLALMTTYLPTLYAHFQFPSRVRLILHTIVSTSFFSTMACMGMGIVTFWSGLFLKLLGYLLRRFLNCELWDYIPQLRGLGEDDEDGIFWIRTCLGVCIGISTTIYLFKTKPGNSQTAQQTFGQEKLAQNITVAEQGGKVKEVDEGPIWAWVAFAYAYTEALFGSKEWVESVFSGVEVERTWGWDRWCFYGPYLVAGVVWFLRRKWIGKTREGKALLQEEKGFDGKEGLENVQV
jgi:hypothetical protein